MLYALLLVLVQLISLLALILHCGWGLLVTAACIRSFRAYVPALPKETRIAYDIRKAKANGLSENESRLMQKRKKELQIVTTFQSIVFLLVLVYLTNPLYHTPLVARVGYIAAVLNLYFLAKDVWMLTFFKEYLKRPVQTWLIQLAELVMMLAAGVSIVAYAGAVMAVKAGIL